MANYKKGLGKLTYDDRVAHYNNTLGKWTYDDRVNNHNKGLGKSTYDDRVAHYNKGLGKLNYDVKVDNYNKGLGKLTDTGKAYMTYQYRRVMHDSYAMKRGNPSWFAHVTVRVNTKSQRIKGKHNKYAAIAAWVPTFCSTKTTLTFRKTSPPLCEEMK